MNTGTTTRGDFNSERDILRSSAANWRAAAALMPGRRCW